MTRDNRDYSRPKTNPHGGVPAFVDPASEPTAVGTDAQVFRSVKALHERLTESEAKAAAAHGALTLEVGGIKSVVGELAKVTEKQDKQLDEQDKKLDTLVADNAEIKGFIRGQTTEREIAARTKSPSSMMRLQHGDASVTLAGKIVDDQLKTREWWRTQTAKIIGAITAGGVLAKLLAHFGVL